MIILIGLLLACVSFMAREMQGLLLVEAKLAFRRDMARPAISEEISRMEDDIRSRVPAARIISIEPGIAESQDVDVPGHESDAGPPTSRKE